VFLDCGSHFSASHMSHNFYGLLAIEMIIVGIPDYVNFLKKNLELCLGRWSKMFFLVHFGFIICLMVLFEF
jgi:hypothetical protein